MPYPTTNEHYSMKKGHVDPHHCVHTSQDSVRHTLHNTCTLQYEEGRVDPHHQVHSSQDSVCHTLLYNTCTLQYEEGRVDPYTGSTPARMAYAIPYTTHANDEYMYSSFCVVI